MYFEPKAIQAVGYTLILCEPPSNPNEYGKNCVQDGESQG